MRKTANIAAILKNANDILSNETNSMTKDEAKSYRYGVCTMIEKILIENEVYLGFFYLDSAGQGVDSQGFLDWEDESRRRYLSHYILND